MFFHEFPFLNTQDINLDWLLANMKSVLEQWAAYQTEMNGKFADLNDAFNALHDFVEEYFDNLDVQEEIDNKINDLVSSGEFYEIILPFIESAAPGIIQGWLDGHPEATTTVQDGAITAAKLHANSVAEALTRDNDYSKDFYKPLSFFPTVNSGYYATADARFVGAAAYRCFRVSTKGPIPLIFGPADGSEPIRYILMLNGEMLSPTYTSIPTTPLPDHDEIRINYHTDTFSSGDVSVYTMEMFQNVIQYPDVINQSLAGAMSWNTIADLPSNFIYQVSNDLGTSFDLKIDNQQSTLIKLQAARHNLSTAWRAAYFQIVEGKVYYKSQGYDWKDLTIADDVTGLNTIVDNLLNMFLPIGDKVTVNHGYYNAGGGYTADERYRSFKVFTSGYPIIYGVTDTPIHWYFRLNGAVVGNYTVLPALDDIPAHDEVRINYRTTTIDTGDVTVYSPEMYTNVLQYPYKLNLAHATDMGYTSISDLPVNQIYQVANDLGDEFGLNDASINSTLIVLQATLHSGNTSWRKHFYQVYNGKIYFKSSGYSWTCITLEDRVHALETTVAQQTQDIRELQSGLDIKPLNILFLGNSFTQDEVGYAPLYLKSQFPELHWNIGLAFKGAGSLQNHYNYLINDTAYTYFHLFTYDADAWITTSSVKPSTIINMFEWDIIVLQQGSEPGIDYSTYQPYLNNLIKEYSARLGHNVKFAYLLPHAYGNYDPRVIDASTTSAGWFALTSAAVQRVLEETGITEIIPSGTALQNARTTSLDDLGVIGDMCADTSSHLQNGAARIAPNYVTFITIAKWLKQHYASPLGDIIVPDSTWLQTHNIPRGNGLTPEGVSNDVIAQNRYLSGICAIQAIKTPFTIYDCSSFNQDNS